MSLWYVTSVPAWLLGLLALFLDFVVLNAIRLPHGRIKDMFLYVSGGPVGDLILLPLLVFGLATMAHNVGSSGWWTQWWWHLVVALVAIFVAGGQQWMSYKAGGDRWSFARLPEQWWHMIIFAVLMYFIVSLIPVIFVYSWQSWEFWLTIVTGVLFVGCLVWDMKHDPIH